MDHGNLQEHNSSFINEITTEAHDRAGATAFADTIFAQYPDFPEERRTTSWPSNGASETRGRGHQPGNAGTPKICGCLGSEQVVLSHPAMGWPPWHQAAVGAVGHNSWSAFLRNAPPSHRRYRAPGVFVSPAGVCRRQTTRDRSPDRSTSSRRSPTHTRSGRIWRVWTCRRVLRRWRRPDPIPSASSSTPPRPEGLLTHYL